MVVIVQGCFGFSLPDEKVKANESYTEDCCKSLTTRGPMTYYFYQNTGKFLGESVEYAIDAFGYRGQNAGYLNPEYQCVQKIGPLRETVYKITYCRNSFNNPPLQRPCSFYLQPQKINQMCGRSDMFIHGCGCCTQQDDSNPPVGGCSSGSIVISHENRKKIRIGDTIIVEHYYPKI